MEKSLWNGWAPRARKSALALLACMATFPGRVESQGRLVDIVYAMDQSGSMRLEYAWIAPDGSDTVYLSGTAGCPGYTNNDLNGFGSVAFPSESGTRQVRRINPNKPPIGCTDFSGDPFSQRAMAFREAIDFQAARAPDSRAGYLGFSSGLHGPIPPKPLDSPPHIDALKDSMQVLIGASTNYLIALDQAKKWLTDPGFSPNPSKAVVFLSDGLPNQPNSSSHLDVLANTYAAAPGTMPPIYGLFMGHSRPDTARLEELSRMTGGRFFIVPPHRPDSLRAVMGRILGIILNPDPSTGAKMARNIILPHPAVRFSGFIPHPGKFMHTGSVFADPLGRIQSAEKPASMK